MAVRGVIVTCAVWRFVSKPEHALKSERKRESYYLEQGFPLNLLYLADYAE